MIAHHREFVDRLMSTSMTPYREPGTLTVPEKVSVKKTGLIPFVPPPPPHKCTFPVTYTVVSFETKKVWFFFKKTKKISKEEAVLEGSLYRCPDCFKVYHFQKEREYQYADIKWVANKKAADLWLEKTGEFVDGEP